MTSSTRAPRSRATSNRRGRRRRKPPRSVANGLHTALRIEQRGSLPKIVAPFLPNACDARLFGPTVLGATQRASARATVLNFGLIDPGTDLMTSASELSCCCRAASANRSHLIMVPTQKPRLSFSTLLARRSLRTTFFVVGHKLSTFEGRRLARRAHEEGHWQSYLEPLGATRAPRGPQRHQ